MSRTRHEGAERAASGTAAVRARLCPPHCSHSAVDQHGNDIDWHLIGISHQWGPDRGQPDPLSWASRPIDPAMPHLNGLMPV